MKILVIGRGGREHALVWKISQSNLISKIFCIPGNAGIVQIADCVKIDISNIKSVVNFVKENNIDLTIVGPEEPLVSGIVDEFEKWNLKIIGPTKLAALLEGSKIFAKNFMKKYQIPTADCKIFSNIEKARNYLKKTKRIPCVIKADGLAAGKGVVVCLSAKEALKTIEEMMIIEKFGNAGKKIIIEDFLEGQEVSCMFFTDGFTAIPMPVAQDHKKIFNNNNGPNTGGMGSFAPIPIITKESEKTITTTIVCPTLDGMRKEGRIYKGILYVGLMITSEGPKVLEFNCRFGDPELQPIVFLMKSDIVQVFKSIIDNQLAKAEIEWNDGMAICVIMAAGGYPEKYETGKEIKGLKEAEKIKNVKIFHAGTKIENEKIVTNGGRVLGVTALGDNILEARKLAYEAVSKISWDKEYHRTDIAKNFET